MGAVNWLQVAVIVGLVSLVVALMALWLFIKIEATLERARRDLVEAHQFFLREDYARIAGESEIYRTEMQGIVAEVQVLAEVFKDALKREDWDPDEHLATLRRMDVEIAQVRMGHSA